MAENIINELLKGRPFWRITPPKEKLLEKIMGLEEEIARYKKPEISLDEGQKHILETCEDYIRIVRELLKAKWSFHPDLAWSLLHRVDERIILLMPGDELSARVIDVKTTFDLTIKEKPVRREWLGEGEKGKLVEAVDNIASSVKNGEKIDEKSRYTVKEALQYLNNVVDKGFWKLSRNILMSVWSAVLLAVFSFLYFRVYYEPCSIPGVMAFAILGLMGAYLSNLLTKEDFLFAQGGQYFRYVLYNLMARPVIGAFSAVFFFLVERSKLIFSINPINPLEKGQTIPQTTLINIDVNKGVEVYVYIVFAIAAGFAGEKILRGMMDKVLKRLETKAEKTKETGSETEKDAGR